MKKLFSLLLIAVLVSAIFAVPVSAFENVNAIEGVEVTIEPNLAAAGNNEVTNVALNKDYVISGIGNRDAYYGNVTDGIVPTDLGSDRNEVWFGFYYNGDRPTNAPNQTGYFIIDLEDVYTLSTIQARLVNKDGWGVKIPKAVTAYVSVDGKAYEEAGSFEISSEDGVAYWTEVEFTGKARYVKVEFVLDGTFAFVSEIEVYGVKTIDEEDYEDFESYLKAMLGAASADPKVEYVIDAPKDCKAGDDITVTVTAKNITAAKGIHVASFNLYYDSSNLLLTNDLDENDYDTLQCVKNMPEGWENFCSVAHENGTDGEATPINNGAISVIVFTADSTESAAVKEDGELVFEFTFKALLDAEGDIGLVIPNAEADAGYNTATGADVYTASGSYAIIEAEPGAYLLGDVNDNGSIEKYDYIAVKRAVLGTLELTDVQAAAADVNNNGSVEKYDYIMIKRHVLGTLTIGN